MSKIVLFWFRRDLRLSDNAGLYHALKSGLPVLPIFIFDKNILDKIQDKNDLRVQFIHQTLTALKVELESLGSTLSVFYGTPETVFPKLIEDNAIEAIYTNNDYERYALERDDMVQEYVRSEGVDFKSFKDQVIFEKKEILSNSSVPYSVFTPYMKKWKAQLTDDDKKSYPTELYFSKFVQASEVVTFPVPSLAQMGFEASDFVYPSIDVQEKLLVAYAEKRDFPSVAGTSRLSVHLRFGTVSIRTLAQKALVLSESWLNELIWRDFYFSIAYNFPHVCEGKAFRPVYDQMEWRNDETEFKAWCEGKTGYPIVDAGMRELNATGFMHNRVRMIVASFLVKHLVIDWRWGEAYFAEKLLDFDFAANNGGWQWASGSGCDAAPYFRVFNPTLQTEKFDKQLAYIKKWVPELNSLRYPQPIVNHEFARKRILALYKKILL
jgi:deoxyribodipyrimidine photo-lyase